MRRAAEGGGADIERDGATTTRPDGAAAGAAREAVVLMHWRPSVAAVPADLALADYLLSAWQRLRSPNRRPPPCPRCGVVGASACGADSSGLPQFLCRACGRRFNRLTGTPMARLRPEGKLRAFFGLASRHWSIAEAARHLGVGADTVHHWSLQTRLWLLQLDPSGAWERRVQLGVHYRIGPQGDPAEAEAVAGCRCAVLAPARPGGAAGGRLVRVCPYCEQAMRA